jgi:hypothetical protein
MLPNSITIPFSVSSSANKGYKCLHVPTNHVYISRDVIFDERVYPFTNNHSSIASPTEEHILLPTLNPPALPLTNDQYTNMAIPTTVHDVSNPPLVSSSDDFRSPGLCTMTDDATTSGAAHASSAPDHVPILPQMPRSVASDPVHSPAQQQQLNQLTRCPHRLQWLMHQILHWLLHLLHRLFLVIIDPEPSCATTSPRLKTLAKISSDMILPRGVF